MASDKEDNFNFIATPTSRQAIYEQREAALPTKATMLGGQHKDSCLPSSSAMPFSSSPPPSNVAPLSIHLSSSVGISSELSDISHDDDGDYDDHLCRGWHFSPRAATPTPFQPILLSRPGSLDTSRQLQEGAAAAAAATATAIPSLISTASPATPLAGHAAATGQEDHFLLSAKLSALTLGEAPREALQGPPYDYDEDDDGFVFQPTPAGIPLHRASISTSPSSPSSPSDSHFHSHSHSHAPSRSSPRALKHVTSTTSLNVKAKAKANAKTAKQLIERVSSTVKNVVTRKSQRSATAADDYGSATMPHSPLGIKTTVTTTSRSEQLPAAAVQHRCIEQEQASEYGAGQYSSSPLAEAQSLLSTSLPRSTVTAASSLPAAASTPVPRGPLQGAMLHVQAAVAAGPTLGTMAEETSGHSRLQTEWSVDAEAGSSGENPSMSMAARWSRAAQGGGEVWQDNKENGPIRETRSRGQGKQQQPSLARLVAMEEGEVKWGRAM